MFIERLVGYALCKQEITSFKGQASWAKVMSTGGQASSTGMPPNQKSKQSGVTKLSL
jgi:hypothetical protein